MSSAVEFLVISHLEAQILIERQVALAVGKETEAGTVMPTDIGDDDVHQHLTAIAFALLVGADV